uniref:Uncharacterized protein n=1 Tax=Ditylenchus dipsaci TaxID=166011 RepID=A0A915EMW7_9BILA
MSNGAPMTTFGNPNLGFDRIAGPLRNFNFGTGLVSQGMLGKGSGDMAIYSLMGQVGPGSMTSNTLQDRIQLRAVNQAELGSQEGTYYPENQKKILQ